ncbi:hypothetical protein QZH41_020601 [Actinostola sp. cb2023]|nr:hypothetical protein QZH41_020601 [Actinostola sp. cb2023]
MVVVTQFNKFGTMINIKRDKPMSSSLTPNDQPCVQSTYSTKVLLGKDEPIWHVYGRQIAIAVSDENDHSNRPVLLAIALKKHSPEILHCITEQIQELRTQNVKHEK